MSLMVVGAGLGRTGTNSLKLALEQLLGGPCYHMFELVERSDEHLPAWEVAVGGGSPDWAALLGDYRATVDWPACAFWQAIWGANRDAFVLLSRRDSAQTWWESMERTIIPVVTGPTSEDPEHKRRRAMIREMLSTTFTPAWQDRDEAIAAYEHHVAHVRRNVPPERLIDWQAGDGWEPICASLGLPVPDQPFPHENRTADFRARQEID